jgi:HEAT repeat protein
MHRLDAAIASFGSEAVDGIRNLLKSRNNDVVHSTIVVIEKIKDPIYLPDLANVLKTRPLYLGIDAAQAIASYGEIAIPSLLDSLDSEDVERKLVNSFIARELAKIGKPALPSLIEATSRTEKSVVIAAAKALGEIKDYRAIPCLKNLLITKDDSEVLMEVSIALGKIGGDSTKKFLYKIANKPKSWFRFTAALVGLVCLGDRAMKASVLDSIANGGFAEENKELDDACRLQLIMGLGLIKETDALPAIYKFKEEMLTENTKQSLKNADAAGSFAEILENILHPKKDPEQEEFELQNKKLDEEHERLMGSK